MTASILQRVDALAERALGAPLPPPALAPFEHLPPAALDGAGEALVARALGRMRQAGVGAADVTTCVTGGLAAFVGQLLPAIAAGHVSQLTFPGRHAGLDDYVAGSAWRDGRRGTFVDVGTGYPPVTTVETADRFPHLEVVGVEPELPASAVVHGTLHATYDASDRFVALQTERALVTAATADDALRERADRLRELLAASLPDGSLDALARWRRPNLRFVRARIGEAAIEGAAVVRCCNVLPYFDRRFRDEATTWFRRSLAPDGFALVGVNFAGGAECRYAVLRREGPDELAFTIDNVRPLGVFPWVDLHGDDDDGGRLARFVGMLRADEAFRDAFDARLDALMADEGLCAREAGQLRFLGRVTSPGAMGGAMARIAARLDADGFVERAAEVLRRHGVRASRNHAGHVTIHDVDARVS